MNTPNQNYTTGNNASDRSNPETFVFFTLKDNFLKQYGLPKKQCPIRPYVLEKLLLNGTLELSRLADECYLYCEQNQDERIEFKDLLVRLSYVAGIIAGKDGNHQQALLYFAQAFKAEPSDIQIGSNYALALSKNERFDESLEIYEKILSFLEDGKVGFSPEVWTESVNLHFRKGNFKRALELVEISIKEAPEFFGDEAKAFAVNLRNRILKR